MLAVFSWSCWAVQVNNLLQKLLPKNWAVMIIVFVLISLSFKLLRSVDMNIPWLGKKRPVLEFQKCSYSVFVFKHIPYYLWSIAMLPVISFQNISLLKYHLFNLGCRKQKSDLSYTFDQTLVVGMMIYDGASFKLSYKLHREKIVQLWTAHSYHTLRQV